MFFISQVEYILNLQYNINIILKKKLFGKSKYVQEGEKSMINFKVGIMGTGSIAGTIADTLNKLEAFEPYAVASRDIARANEFGDKYNVTKRYGSYEEIISDPDVELIYIATPHAFHAEEAKMCINAGKPVLVEKAFSYNAATTEEVLRLSDEKGVFCGEAMWIRFMPIYKQLYSLLGKGVIGRVCSISCSLAYDLKTKDRLKSPELAGGVLLDLGVYPINLFSMFFGPAPASVQSACAKLDTGVDAQDMLQFTFQGGRFASAVISMLYRADNNATIYGEHGYVEIDNINCPTGFRIYTGDQQLVSDTSVNDKQISGYEYEFIEARNAIILGKTECIEMPHAETLRIMKMLDNIRGAWKIKYPME